MSGLDAELGDGASPTAQEQRLPDWSTLPPPHPALALCVVMPVRDEARRLAASLRALAQQVDAQGAALPAEYFEVIVLANNCQDRSAHTARRFAAAHPQLVLHVVEVRFPPALAHVGQARACLMDEACRRLHHSPAGGPAGIIASTDGDTRVHRRWISAMQAEFAAGAHAVGGRIVSRAQPGDAPALRALVRADDRYRHWRARLESLLDPVDADPWPRHHQHFGASLAVRADAYQAVGGCPPEPWLEDEALVRALRRHDLRLRHSPRVRVTTSGRRQGRVAVGLSQQLRAWATMAESGDEPQVPDPAIEAEWLRHRAALRRVWFGPAAVQPAAPAALAAWARCLLLPPDTVAAAWRDARHFGAFCDDTESLARALHPVPLLSQAVAVQRLRRLCADAQAAAGAA